VQDIPWPRHIPPVVVARYFLSLRKRFSRTEVRLISIMSLFRESDSRTSSYQGSVLEGGAFISRARGKGRLLKVVALTHRYNSTASLISKTEDAGSHASPSSPANSPIPLPSAATARRKNRESTGNVGPRFLARRLGITKRSKLRSGLRVRTTS